MKELETPVPGERESAIEITVRGTVQGVGFRPFVHRIAAACGLSGWVENTPGAVVVRVEGDGSSLSRFRGLLRAEAPPAARMARLSVRRVRPSGARGFEIRESRTEGAALSTIPPHIATCPDCLTRPTAATAIRSPTARIAGHVLPSSNRCRTTAPTLR